MEKEFYTAREVKDLAEKILKESDIVVSRFAKELGVSRQYLYQAVTYKEERPLEGIDLCRQVLRKAGLEMDERYFFKITKLNFE